MIVMLVVMATIQNVVCLLIDCTGQPFSTAMANGSMGGSVCQIRATLQMVL